MATEGDIEFDPAPPRYRSHDEINVFEIRDALCSLHLFGGDIFLSLQAMNIAVVDKFIMEIEHNVLRELLDTDRTPPEAMFLSAQSQMWVFAAYEALRTWRERAKNVINWHENSGIPQKIKSLEQSSGFINTGKESFAQELRKIIDDPCLIGRIKEDLKLVHIPFARLEYIRINFAKHQVPRKLNSFAVSPGYGRINQRCGSLDYQLENDSGIFDVLNRRDIGDELRGLSDRSRIPSDEDIRSFDSFMKRPPSNPF